MRVVDQALPARGGARLLEVDAHRHAEVVRQLLGLARPGARRTRARRRRRARCTGPTTTSRRSSARSRIACDLGAAAQDHVGRPRRPAAARRASALAARSGTTRSIRWSRTRSARSAWPDAQAAAARLPCRRARPRARPAQVVGEVVGAQRLRAVADAPRRDRGGPRRSCRRRPRRRRPATAAPPARAGPRRGWGRRSPAGGVSSLSTGTAIRSSVKR